ARQAGGQQQSGGAVGLPRAAQGQAAPTQADARAWAADADAGLDAESCPGRASVKRAKIRDPAQDFARSASNLLGPGSRLRSPGTRAISVWLSQRRQDALSSFQIRRLTPLSELIGHRL